MAAKGQSKMLSQKAAPVVAIWQDGGDEAVPASVTTATPNLEKPASRPVRPKGQIVDENTIRINSSSNSNSSSSSSSSSSSGSGKRSSSPHKLVDAKKAKIEMSQEEKTMNGAPEGDLYDVKVLLDEELPSLEASGEEVVNELAGILASSSGATASWADKYATVEMIRRVVVYHAEALSREVVLFTASLEAAIQAIESLRSCSVRNGISCLRNMVAHCPAVLEGDHAGSLLEALMNRSATGPKFICESASEVITSAAAKMTPTVLTGALNPLTLHRNGEISSLSHYLIAQSVLNFPGAFNAQDPSISSALVVLCRGLSAKRPNGRESSRLALLRLQAVLGEVTYEEMTAAVLTVAQIAEMNVEMRKTASTPAASSSSSSSSSSRFPTPASGARVSIKDAMLLKRNQMKTASATKTATEGGPPSPGGMGVFRMDENI